MQNAGQFTILQVLVCLSKYQCSGLVALCVVGVISLCMLEIFKINQAGRSSSIIGKRNIMVLLTCLRTVDTSGINTF